MSSFKIKGNRVVITGGAGGIGSALVKGFVDAGSEVLVSAREASQFESLKEFLTANNSPTTKLHYVLADFADPKQCGDDRTRQRQDNYLCINAYFSGRFKCIDLCGS